MLFSATWRQKSQKIDFMNVFHGFIGFGSETANIFNTCRSQGAYIVQYIVNSCRGCWQYTISIVAGIKNHISVTLIPKKVHGTIGPASVKGGIVSSSLSIRHFSNIA